MAMTRMDEITYGKIRNTMKSFEGRMKALEHDPKLDLSTFCDRAASLEHEFYEVIKRLLNEKPEKIMEGDVCKSSIQIAKDYGVFDEGG